MQHVLLELHQLELKINIKPRYIFPSPKLHKPGKQATSNKKGGGYKHLDGYRIDKIDK